MKYKFTSIIIFLFTLISFGQNSIKPDSTYIESFVDKIILKVNVDNRSNVFVVNDRSNNTSLTIESNSNLRLFLSLDYEFIGVSIGFSPEFLPGNNDDDLKGKSSFSDFRFRFFLGNLVQGIHYANSSGFYVKNTGDFIPGWIEGTHPYLQFPDFKIQEIGGQTSYVFNPKFSFRNVVYQTEWQKKSAGSLIPSLRYSFDRFSNNTETIKNQEDVFDLKLSLAYYYTWVLHKNWYVAPFLSPAIGGRFSNYELSENGMGKTKKEQYFTKSLEGGFNLGYSSRKIIFGLNFNFNVSEYNEDKSNTIINDQFYGLVYFGIRLDAPKFVQKPFKWINKQFGLE